MGPNLVSQDHHDEMTSDEKFHDHIFKLIDEYANYHPEGALKLVKDLGSRYVGKIDKKCDSTIKFHNGLQNRIASINTKIHGILYSDRNYVHKHSLEESVSHTHKLID